MNLQSIDSSSLISVKRESIPYSKLHSSFTSRWQNKKHIKKYFGRKKTYAENGAGRNAALHRSKYFLKFKHTDTRIFAFGFRSLGNLIFFATDLILKDDRDVYRFLTNFCSINTNLIPWKRAFGYCRQAYSTDETSVCQKYMSCLKSLRINISQQRYLNKLARILPNLRLLESIRLQYAPNKDLNCAFLARIHKLPRLQSFYFDTNISALRNENLQKDIRAFYKQIKIPVVYVTIHRSDSFSEEGRKTLECLLKGADCLCLEFSSNQSFCCNEDFSKSSVSEKKRLISQSKRIVHFANSFWPQDKTNVSSILSSCEALKFLYINMSISPKFWIEDELSLQAKMNTWCQSLKSVVLDFGFFHINPVFDVDIPKEQEIKIGSEQSKVFLTSHVLNLVRELRKNAVSLEDMSLSLCISNLQAKNYDINVGVYDAFEVEKRRIMEDLVKEISLINKLKKFCLCSQGNLVDFPLNQIVYLECLEKLNFGFCKKKEIYWTYSEKIEKNWDQHLCLGNEISHAKELKIKTSTDLKIQPFGMQLVTAMINFQNLQVFEMIDQNKMLITFDLLYGLLMNVFKSKNIKRVLISTNVTNGFYSKDLNAVFPQQVGSYIQQIEKELFTNIEMRIRELIGLKLEEVAVGRLTGFMADYLLYHKGLEERILFTENEFQELKMRKSDQWNDDLRALDIKLESENEHFRF